MTTALYWGGDNHFVAGKAITWAISMKIETFRGGQNFLGPLNGHDTSNSEWPFWGKKSQMALIMAFPATK